MFRAFVLVFFSLLGSSAALGDPLPYVTSERAIETSSDLVVLPIKAPGTLLVRACMTCTAQELHVTENTALLARRTAVTLTELRQLAAQKHNMGIFVDLKTGALSRVVIYADAASATAAAKRKRS